MRGWRKEARGLSLDREFQERARRHDVRRAGRVALRAWLDACGKMDAEQEAKLRYALGEMSGNRKFAVLAKWGGYVTLMRKRKQALRRALEVAMEAEEDRLARSVLRGWLAAVELERDNDDDGRVSARSPWDRRVAALAGDRAGAFWRERRAADAFQAWASYTSAMNIDAGEAISAAITRHSAESSRGGGSERAAYSLHSRFDTPAARSGVGEAARLKLRLRDLAMSVSHEDVYRSAGRR